ncbi:hypothetical protein TRSC58_05015 [Trypanosoma rangeli SC58]|uniref:Uncharacterized protein n=1 Tax=Trypanosoma rangeli SC58 TaxID=429131 RepID=A0A061IVW8_TRYRA|nr:hypothetical protein TRSC58_05015 [Trypanosoma rangeli SC58]
MSSPPPCGEVSHLGTAIDEVSTTCSNATPTATASDAGVPPSCRSGCSRVLQAALVLFTLLAFVMCVMGMSGTSYLILRTNCWDEVFVVAGTYCLFYAVIAVCQTTPRMPCVTHVFGAKLCVYALQLLLWLTYLAQQAVLLAYLVMYVGPLCWLFLIPDFAVAGMLAVTMTLTTSPAQLMQHWPAFYVFVQAGKLGVLWSVLGGAIMSATRMGPDGLLGSLMLTILLVQFPVLLSRLRVGMSLTRAYTTNMAAVFAHVLHFMDVLQLYFTGTEMPQFPINVNRLVLFLAIMGHITSNMYYTALFLKDEETARFLRRFEARAGDGTDLIACAERARDDELLHYFLWTFFFIDLPYAVVRLVSLVVHGTEVSVFLGKNFMMAVGVVMLLMRGRTP